MGKSLHWNVIATLGVVNKEKQHVQLHCIMVTVPFNNQDPFNDVPLMINSRRPFNDVRDPGSDQGSEK